MVDSSAVVLMVGFVRKACQKTLVFVYQLMSRRGLDEVEAAVRALAAVTTYLRYSVLVAAQGNGVSGQVDDFRQVVVGRVCIDNEVSFLGRYSG